MLCLGGKRFVFGVSKYDIGWVSIPFLILPNVEI